MNDMLLLGGITVMSVCFVFYFLAWRKEIFMLPRLLRAMRLKGITSIPSPVTGFRGMQDIPPAGTTSQDRPPPIPNNQKAQTDFYPMQQSTKHKTQERKNKIPT